MREDRGVTAAQRRLKAAASKPAAKKVSKPVEEEVVAPAQEAPAAVAADEYAGLSDAVKVVAQAFYGLTEIEQKAFLEWLEA